MMSKVTLKVLQYKLGDRLDRIRLPGNPRVVISRKDGAGTTDTLYRNHLASHCYSLYKVQQAEVPQQPGLFNYPSHRCLSQVRLGWNPPRTE